jgi:PAS domain-containing protein
MNEKLESLIFLHMKQKELHCLVIRGHVGRYPALVQALSKFSNNIKIDLIDNDAVTVKKALLNKKLGLVFLFQESGLAVDALADILKKNGSESILVSLDDDKPQSALSVRAGYTGVQVCNLHYRPSGSIVNLALKFLIQYAFLKTEFRNCKSLLRVSEQRCHWLVDSSSEAVAYVANDLHLYANNTYIDLLSNSLHSLKITAVSDLILEDEREVFFDFVRQYENKSAKASALIVTLHPLTGEDFRASIRLIPTIFSGTRCYQLWIRKLGSGRLPVRAKKEKLGFDASSSIEINEINEANNKTKSPWEDPSTSKNQDGASENAKSVIVGSTAVESPFIVKQELTGDIVKNRLINQLKGSRPANRSVSIRTEKFINSPLSKKPSVYNTLLKQVLLSSEVSLELSKLDRLNHVEGAVRQYIVDLNVSEHEYNGVSSVLDKKFHATFWDQAMLLLLFQRFKQAGSKDMRLLVPITEVALKDDLFKHWLGESLSRFKRDVSSCVFLLPLSTDLFAQNVGFKKLQAKLHQHHCRIGIDNFEINQQTKTILQSLAPEFVRFSKKWVLANITNNKQALKLASTIKILEKNKVKVIAPHKSGKKMKQLFDISGASFCQKMTVS